MPPPRVPGTTRRTLLNEYHTVSRRLLTIDTKGPAQQPAWHSDTLRARRAIHAAAQAPIFAGSIRTHRQARDILGNPALTVYDNPHSFLMCVYNRDRAPCHRLDGTDAPSLDRCQSSCANIARTDRHADELVYRAHVLEKQAASDAVSGPLADRLTRRADHLRGLADRHNHDRTHSQESTA